MDTYLSATPYPVIGVFGSNSATNLVQSLMTKIGKKQRMIVCCRTPETADRYRAMSVEHEVHIVHTMGHVDEIWLSHVGPMVYKCQELAIENRAKSSRPISVMDVEYNNRTTLLFVLEDQLVESTGSACMSEILGENKRYGCSFIFTCAKRTVAREYSSRSQTKLMLIQKGLALRTQMAFCNWINDDAATPSVSWRVAANTVQDDLFMRGYRAVFESRTSGDKKFAVIFDKRLYKYIMQ